MKSRIEKILYKHSDRVGLYEGGVITCIDENEFDDLAEELVKLFTIPAVVGRSEQFICRDCGENTIEWADGLCENCTLKGFR